MKRRLAVHAHSIHVCPAFDQHHPEKLHVAFTRSHVCAPLTTQGCRMKGSRPPLHPGELAQHQRDGAQLTRGGEKTHLNWTQHRCRFCRARPLPAPQPQLRRQHGAGCCPVSISVALADAPFSCSRSFTSFPWPRRMSSCNALPMVAPAPFSSFLCQASIGQDAVSSVQDAGLLTR